MTLLVETKDLSRRFGRLEAVKRLNLGVERGTVLGLIGPNGAGKTTTLKMLATILGPSSGQATVAGHCVRRERTAVRKAIGYMPDVSGLYEDMLVHEYLRFFCSVYGIRRDDAEKRIDGTLGLTGLTGKLNEPCGALSRGMSQRLHLARVLLHDPELLLLDEPASGLDPRARIEFKELVLTLRKMGKTLIISSHILTELGEMCDTVAIIEKSELVYHGGVEHAVESVHAQGKVVLVQVRETEGRTRLDLMETARSLSYVDAVREGDRDGCVLVRFQPDHREAYVLNAELVARGFQVERFSAEQARLEDAFLHLTKGIVQ